MRQLIGLLLLMFSVQPLLAKDKASADCEKNVSFAVAEGGQIVPRVPTPRDDAHSDAAVSHALNARHGGGSERDSFPAFRISEPHARSPGS
jgi:hypothetical protein